MIGQMISTNNVDNMNNLTLCTGGKGVLETFTSFKRLGLKYKFLKGKTSNFGQFRN